MTSMREILQRAAVLVWVMLFGTCLLVAQSTKQDEPAPDVPDAIQVPAGQKVVLYAHATGSQIYTCQAAASGKFAWALKGPDAELHDRKDKVIGHHSAGPTWKLTDGSEVTGKAVAHVESLDSESIPWLLVNVVSHAGNGQLSGVTTIQRVRTHGGQAPSTGCDAAHVNAETKSNYSADYYFYAPAN
ncbi:MAG: DUF3455 domain-containing protein [Candidatus Sulfotelmatobacter sp.]|jgi:hypothetical protein